MGSEWIKARGMSNRSETMKDETKQTKSKCDETVKRPRRKRAGRKRVKFSSFPRPAPSVKALWSQASEEERKRAHQLCMAILEYWVGRTTKEDLAERLEVPPLRIWQLSQQALSGMLAGLLRQPRRRATVGLPPADPETDPKPLRLQIAELEKKLARTEDLVRVLKHLPWAKGDGDGGSSQERKARKSAKAKRSRATPHREKAVATANGGKAETG